MASRRTRPRASASSSRVPRSPRREAYPVDPDWQHRSWWEQWTDEREDVFDREWFISEPEEEPPDVPEDFLALAFEDIDISKIPGVETVERDGEVYTVYEAELLDAFAKAKAAGTDAERRETELKAQQAAIAERQRAQTALKRKTEALSKPLQLAPERKERKRLSVEKPGASLLVAAAAAAGAAGDGPARRAAGGGGAAAAPSASVPKRPKREKLEEEAVEGASSWDALDPAGVVAFDGFPWSSSAADEALELPLPGFPANDTLVLRVSVPATSDIWALNVVPRDHDDGATLLYHFNPRRKERGGTLVENDKFDDDWGRASKVSLPRRPPLFGLAEAELVFKLRATPGAVDVHVTVDRIQACAWRLRCDLPASDLAVLVPTTDDFGNREDITIHSAWWGKLGMLPTHRPPQVRR